MNNFKKIAIWSLIIAYVYFNYYLSNVCETHVLKYFFIPFKDLISVLVVTYVVYFFVEHKNDTRNKKRSIERIVSRIIENISEERMHNIKDFDDINYIRIIQKSIFNEIDLLDRCAKEFSIESDVEYCKKEFENYWNLISNHINDLRYLQKSRYDLFNNLINLSNKVETIALKIYE